MRINAPQKSGLGFFRGLLLLLLEFLRPRRHHTVHTRVGYRLAQVLSPVPVHHHESTAKRRLPVEHFLRLIRITVCQSKSRFPLYRYAFTATPQLRKFFSCKDIMEFVALGYCIPAR